MDAPTSDAEAQKQASEDADVDVGAPAPGSEEEEYTEIQLTNLVEGDEEADTLDLLAADSLALKEDEDVRLVTEETAVPLSSTGATGSSSDSEEDDVNVVVVRSPIHSPVVKWLWGDITREELKKYLYLAALFACIIGVYWLLRPMKDPVFSRLVGIDHQPQAKILSVFVIIPLVMLYSKLADVFTKKRLFVCIASFYMVGLLVLMCLLWLFGNLSFTHQKLCPFESPSTPKASNATATASVEEMGDCVHVPPPDAWNVLGWLNTVFVESYASIMVAMFWSFVASQSNPSESKRG